MNETFKFIIESIFLYTVMFFFRVGGKKIAEDLRRGESFFCMRMKYVKTCVRFLFLFLVYHRKYLTTLVFIIE